MQSESVSNAQGRFAFQLTVLGEVAHKMPLLPPGSLSNAAGQHIPTCLYEVILVTAKTGGTLRRR